MMTLYDADDLWAADDWLRSEVRDDFDAVLAHPRGERIVEGTFNRRARADGNTVGYDTIAASGHHACILHWTRNDGAVQPGDLIRNFGYVDAANHDQLKKVAECVQANAGQSVLVKISRPSAAPSQRELQLTLVPRQGWGGRGLLGCHILPL